MSATQIRDLRAARIRLGFEIDLTELPPQIRRAIEEDRSQGLGWRHDGLKDWSTQDVFRKLQEMSIDTDAARFREQADQAAGVLSLGSSWLRSAETTGPWADFPLVAAEELWYRLLPGIDCPEIVSRRLDEAVLAGSTDNIRIPTGEAERSNLWRAVTDFLDYVAQPAADSQQSRYARAQACSPIDYENIFLELIKQADGSELDEAARLAALVRAKPDPLTLGYMGMAFARAGRSEEAQEAIGANLALHPENAWTHETAGEVHLLLGQTEPAIACFQLALRRAESALHWGALLDRMCTAATTHAPDPASGSTVCTALDRLADEVPPPDN